MQKIKNAIKGHRRHGEDEYDTTTGATTYGGTSGAATGYGPETVGHHGTAAAGTGYGAEHARGMGAGEVEGEHPVAVGVAEVPIVVTEQERVTGTHETHHTDTHHETHHTHAAGRVSEEVCGQKTFTEVEDRPVVRERVERIVEHRPVEKQYVVETRFVGEKETGVAGAEIVDVKDRVVDVAAPGPTCPVNTGAVMNEVVQGVQGTSMAGTGMGTGMGHTHATDRL